MDKTSRETTLNVERAALACALREPNAALEIVGLDDRLFTQTRHRRLWAAIADVIGTGAKPDLVNVPNSLRRLKSWNAETDDQDPERWTTADLVDLVDVHASGANYKHYIQELRRFDRTRRLRAELQNFLQQTERLLEPKDFNAAMDSLQRSVFAETIGDNNERGLRPCTDIVRSAFDECEARYNGEVSPYGIRSGLHQLDRLTGGFYAGDLIIVAGRPGHGKSSLALDIAVNAARQGTSTALFSLEMSTAQLGQRLLSKGGGVPIHHVRLGNVGSDDWARLVNATGDLSEIPLHICDDRGLTPARLRAKLLAWETMNKRRIELVLVDYLQLMRPNERHSNREREIAEISRSLKVLAGSHNIPVIALSQLNRKVEERANKRPMLADLRESGAIEQDGDVIIGVYIPSMYEPEVPPEGRGRTSASMPPAEPDPNAGELIVLKQRNGGLGKIDVRWERTTATFSDPNASRGELRAV